MIVFKNNKIEVENPKNIELTGVYYGIVITSEAISNELYRCYIYIPEIYGPFDHIWSRAADYPRVIIPLKQDSDDEGHIPQTGEVVKISFDNGSVNDCRFCYLVPIGEEQKVRNANYITKGILSANIEDITDPDIINKLLQFLNYAYYITINSKTSINDCQPTKDDYKIQMLVSNTNFCNYFIEPLIMPLAAQGIDGDTNDPGVAGVWAPPFFTSVIYLMYDVLKNTPETQYDNLLEIWNNPPSRQASDYGNFASYNPDSIKENDDKVYAAACLLSGIPLFAIQVAFPDATSDVANANIEGTGGWGSCNGVTYPWTLYRAYQIDEKQGWGKNYYSEFLFSQKTNYEKEWAETMSSWLSGINALSSDETGFNIIVAFCLNICPWMATTLIGYDIGKYQIQQNAYNELEDEYERAHKRFSISERTYDAVFGNDQDFTKASEALNEALKQADATNFIDVFETQASACFQNMKISSPLFEDAQVGAKVNSWEYFNIHKKFEKLKNCAKEIMDKWHEATHITTPGGSTIVGGSGAKRYFDIPLDHDLQDYIYNLCVENGVPYELMIGLIETESGFNPNTISSTDDYGLCQINKINHASLSKQYGITNFLDPYQNCLCGVKILSGHLHNYNGDVHKALMAYNMGAGGASKLWAQGIYTSQYSRKVFAAYQKYLNM